MSEKKINFICGLIALILAILFMAAFAHDYLMGCGEPYYTAQGLQEPDNQGCIFFGAGK